MITEHEEVARYRVAEQIRAAEARAQRKEAAKPARHGRSAARTGHRPPPPGRPARARIRRLAEPQPRHRGTGLSVVR